MKQILCFGDSNTYGLIPGTTGRYPWGVRWTSLLAESVRDQGYQVVEEGLCGRTTMYEDSTRIGRRGTQILPVLLESHRPVEIVVLMLGTNDCKTAYQAGAQDIGGGIEQLIDQIRLSDPHISILLISPITLGEGVWETGYDTDFDSHSKEVSEQLADVYRSIAQRRNLEFLAASEYVSASRTDREHLDAEGHYRLAAAVTDTVQDMIRHTTCSEDPELLQYDGAAS